MSDQDFISAIPSKRIYRSIISDYGLRTSICELIDNAYDAWFIAGQHGELKIAIDVDVDPQTITFTDNSGGVEKSELRKLISPGESSTSGQDATVGIFGIGCKRAVVAVAKQVQITTRFKSKSIYKLVFDDDWLKTESWDIQVSLVPNIDPGTTKIFLSNLRFSISKSDVTELKHHLEATYAYLLQQKQISISLGSDKIGSYTFENWSYPPNFEPRRFNKTVKPENRPEVTKVISARLSPQKPPRPPQPTNVNFKAFHGPVGRFGFFPGTPPLPNLPPVA